MSFVILLHSGHGADHYDLMVQQGPALATWQLADDPRTLPVGQSRPAHRLADHRLAYLDYEGPVSRGRGEVRRVLAGLCRIVQCHPTHWKVEMEAPGLAGTYELRQDDTGSDGWTITRLRSGPR